MITRSIENAQVKVESHHFDMRKHLVDYDDVVNTHRDVIYKLRRKILGGEELRETILDMVHKELVTIADIHLTGDPINWDFDGFQRGITLIMPISKELAKTLLRKRVPLIR